MMKNGSSFTVRRRYWAALFGLISLGFVLSGFLFYRHESDRIRRDRYLDLKTVAGFKANQIRQWRQERLADVTMATRSPFFARAVESLSGDPVRNSRETELRERLELDRAHNGYSDVLVVSTDGRILFSLEASPAPLSRADNEALAESLRRQRAVMSEPYRSPAGRMYVDAVAPVATSHGTHRVLLVYRIDADAYLRPLVMSWPGPSPSAETLLVRREGRDVLFLNQPRHRTDAALSLRYPLSRTEVPAVQAVLGKQGMFLGKDYRGVEVMADLRPIPDSTWYMVAKIDADEVLAEATYRAGFISLAVFLFFLSTGLLIAYAYRHRQAGLYRTLYRSEQEQKESYELFRTTLYSIGDAVITTYADGTIREMNGVAEEITGWSEHEAQGRPIQEVFRIINEQTRNEVENPVAHVLRAGTVVGLANHTLLIARNGTEHPIADSGAPIKNDDGGIVGVVMVFRDQTEERRAEAMLRDSRDRLDLALRSARMGTFQLDLISDRRYFDEQVCSLLGISHREFTPREEFYRAVHPDDREKAQAVLTRAIEEDAPYETEFRAVWPDGSVHHIAVRGRLIRDDAGKPVRLNGINWDVTERVRNEATLRASEAKFRSYMEWAPLAVFVTEPEGGIVDFNPAALELLGYDRSTLAQMSVWELLPVEDREEGRQRYADFQRDGFIKTEFRFQKKDGSFVWVALHANMMGDGTSLGYCYDVTDRKKAVETLRRYELLSGNSRDIILFMERDGKLVEVNTAAENAYGYSREELLTLTIRDLRAPETLESATRHLAEADSRGILFETMHRRKDGSIFPVEVGSRGADIDGTRMLISVVRDITQRKAAEETLQATTARLMRAEEMARTGNWELDLAGEVIRASLGATRIYGLPGSEWPLASVQQIPLPEYREKLDSTMVGLIGGTVPYDLEFKIRRADNGDVVDVRSVAEYDPHRHTVFGVIQDVTAKKRLEEQLRQAQKMEAIGTLAGGVAHDFNNILTVIMGLGNLVQMSLGHDDRLRPHIDQIVLSSERAADLTQSLLAFSRKQRINLVPHQVCGVVESTAKLLKRLLPEDITLNVDTADRKAVALLDVAQIDQVLMNLATNARDAMPQGGTLTIRTDVATLDETFRRSHGFGRAGIYAHLSVSDSGTGMDAQTMSHIFDPFFTTKEVGKGTGLGLASAFGIVKQHNGYITVSSAPSRGTTFDIYLPLVDTADRPEAAATQEVRGGSETILILEDDGDVRNMIVKILTDQGYTTVEAANGDDAIRVFNEHRDRIDLVILDVVMPGRNGREVLDEIVRTEPGVKAIFMSGYTGDVVIDKGVEREAVDFLQKPLSVTNLLLKVREVLDR